MEGHITHAHMLHKHVLVTLPLFCLYLPLFCLYSATTLPLLLLFPSVRVNLFFLYALFTLYALFKLNKTLFTLGGGETQFTLYAPFKLNKTLFTLYTVFKLNSAVVQIERQRDIDIPACMLGRRIKATARERAGEREGERERERERESEKEKRRDRE